MGQPIVWIIGDWKQAEFDEAVQWLKTQCFKGQARCTWFDDAAAALSSLRAVEGVPAPPAILLIQSRPGQIRQGDLERLHAAAPLARLVALVGAWCEGELRNGQAWRGVVRIPASAWSYRLGQALGLSGENAARLPRTATATERIEAMTSSVESGSSLCRKAVVLSSRQSNYEAIADLLQRLGVEVVGKDKLDECDVAVVDGWEEFFPPLECRDGRRLPRVVILHFAGDEDWERARREGIEAVIAQPALLADLEKAVEMAISRASGAYRFAAVPEAGAAGLCEGLR
jgi:hypothetical protein